MDFWKFLKYSPRYEELYNQASNVFKEAIINEDEIDKVKIKEASLIIHELVSKFEETISSTPAVFVDVKGNIPDHNIESSSCPRVAWDKYREENGRIVMLLNVTVNHCFVDGYPLSQAFMNVQSNFEKAFELCH